MGIFGKVLAAPVRLVNAPLRAVEAGLAKAMGEEDHPEDRFLSVPLEEVAQVVEAGGDAAAQAMRGEG